MTALNQNNIESELKLDLGPEDNFIKLLKMLSWKGAPEHQINYFFDTPDFLLRTKRFALRIRKQEDRYFLTVKGPKISQGDLAVRNEIECEMTEADALSVIHDHVSPGSFSYPPLKWLEDKTGIDFTRARLVMLLSFENFRHRVIAEDSGKKLVLEFDRTDFGRGRIDYELEVEFESNERYHESKKMIQELLKQAGIPWILSSKSKFAKALEWQ